MNSVSEMTEKTTGEGIVMEAEGSHPQASGARETVNISVDFFKNMQRASVPGKKRLTPKRKEIIQDFFSKTYAREEVKQRYGAILPANHRVLELIKQTLNGKTTKRASKVTELDIRDWIVKYPRFFIKAEEKGREEYNLRKEAEVRCSEQEVASGSAAVVEEAQPIYIETEAQADENQAFALELIGLSPLSDQEKLALIGLLVGVETSQSGNFVQPPVSFQLVAWISQVLAAATENAVKENIVPASEETFKAILNGSKKTCDTLGTFLQWLNGKAVNQPVRNEGVEERILG